MNTATQKITWQKLENKSHEAWNGKYKNRHFFIIKNPQGFGYINSEVNSVGCLVKRFNDEIFYENAMKNCERHVS